MSDSSIPSIRTFQMDASTVGVLKSSVNLFRGDVNTTQNLFSMPGRNDDDGLQIDLSIQYQSNIHEQAMTWNRDQPTGVLGLGWTMPMAMITRDSGSFPLPTYSIQAAGVASPLVQEPDSAFLFSMESRLASQLTDGQPVPVEVRAAFVSRGLPLSASAVVVGQADSWKLKDDAREQSFKLILEQGALNAYDGGESFQLVNYKFWKVIYYPEYERWAVTNEYGLSMSYGGGVTLTTQKYKTSTGNSIEWGVQWVDAQGVPYWQGNSAVTTNQAQFAKAWHLARAYSRFGEFVSYGYNEFSRDGNGLLEAVEQSVGAGGKPYTKACYLTSLTDVFGRKVLFSYAPKLWSQADPSSPREYADPHKAVPDGTPNGFQDCYETRYLDHILVQHMDGSALFSLQFLFEPTPAVPDIKAVANVAGSSGDTCKRFLTGFRLLNPAKESLPGYNFDYYLDPTQPNPGAIRSITWPTGGTALYTYKSVDLTICQRTATLTPPSPMPANSIPRLWFGPDYAVVLWNSSSSSQMSLQILTWNGLWLAWQPDPSTPLLVNGQGGTSLSTVQVDATQDFVGVTYNTSTATNLHLFRKDPARPGQWVAAAVPGGGTGGCNNPTWHWLLTSGSVQIQAGQAFLMASQMSTSHNSGTCDLFTWNWSSQTWSHDPQAASTYQWVTVGQDYFATVDMNSNVAMHHFTPTGTWESSSAVNLGFKLNNFTSLALAGGKAMVAVSHLTSGGPASGQQVYDVYLAQWNASYIFGAPSKHTFKDQVDAQYPTPWSPTVLDDSLVAVAGNLMRFDGQVWRENSRLKPTSFLAGWQQRYAYGPDFATMVYVGTGQPKAQLVDYDANQSGTWTNPAVPISGLVMPSSNQSTANWPSATNPDFMTVGNLLFFRGTTTRWADSIGTPLCDMQALINGGTSNRYQLNTASVVNEGPAFIACAVYDTSQSGAGHATASTALVLRNGSVYGTPGLLLGNQMWTAQESDLSGQGTSPGGPSAFFTYPDTAQNLDAARVIYLNRYAGNAIQGPISDWPVASITIDDGLSESFTTSYVQDTATAACDTSGQVIKYYQSTVYPGGSPANPAYGSVVSRYLNGNQIMTGADFYNMLDGLLYSVTTLDAQGRVLMSTTNTWMADVKRAGDPVDPDAPVRQLFGAYILQTAQSQQRDGVNSSQLMDYVPAGLAFTYTGQPARTSTSTMDGNGKAETAVQQNTYACEISSASKVLNDVSSVAGQTTTQAGITTASGVTALVGWPTVWGEDVLIPAEEADFGWTGGSAAFPFGTYEPGQTPADFQCTMRILQRDATGAVLEQMDGAGTTMATLFSTALGFPVATFKGAARAECAWNGFQSYEDPSGWNVFGTSVCQTQAWLGSQSLRLSPGALVSTTATPAAGRTKYLLSFRYLTPSGYVTKGSGWTITAGGQSTFAPLEDTAGQWRYVTAPVPIPPGTSSIVLSGANTGSADVLLDGILLVPFGTDVIIQSWEADTRLLRATMNAGGATNFTLYDNFRRALGAVGADGNLQELDIRFQSRQGNATALFDNACPNAELTVQMVGGGTSETFLDEGAWSRRWTPGNSSLWNVSKGVLSKASPTPDILTWHGGLGAATAGVFYLEITPIGALGGAMSIVFGKGQSITWTPNLGWSWRDASGKAIQSPLAEPPQMATQWLLILEGEALLFFGDGQLLFSQSSSATPAQGFAFQTGATALQVDHLIFGAQPRLGLSYTDGAARQRQVHQMQGSDSRVMEIVYDALDCQLANTRIAPGSFGTGAQIPNMRYRSTFLDVPKFMASLQNTCAMAGDVAAYYGGQQEGPVQRSNDKNYPYTGLRYDGSALGRIVESGKPGLDLSIHDVNTLKPSQRHTTQTTYAASTSSDPLPTGQYYAQTTTTPGGSLGRLLLDTTNRAVATLLLDSEGTLVGQTQNGPSYSDREGQAGTTGTLRLPNVFMSGPQSDPAAFVRTTTQDPLGQVTRCTDPDTQFTQYLCDGKGKPRFVQVAQESGSPYFQYTRYDALGRILEEGMVKASWNVDILKAQVNNDAYPAPSEGAVPSRLYTYDGDGSNPNDLGQLTQVKTLNPAPDNNPGLGACTVEEGWSYDALGRVITASLTISGAISHVSSAAYHYNNLNEIIQVDLPQGSPIPSIVYTYDDQGQIIAVGIPGQPEALATYTWNADGQLLTSTRGAMEEAWAYDSTGNILLHQVVAGSTTLFRQQYDYNYDSQVSGRQTQSALSGGTTQRDVTYRYDEQHRFVSAVVADGQPGNQAITQYDPNGNIWTGTQEGKAFSMVCSAGTDRLAKATLVDGNQVAFQYRNDGRPSQWRGLQVVYDLALGTVSAVVKGSTSVRYARGLNNHRVLRQCGSDVIITLQGAGNAPLVQWVNGQPQVCIWGASGLTAVHDGTLQYAITDHQHTVWGVADASGNPVASFDYLPFGGLLGTSGSRAKGWLFTYAGKEWDAALELYDFGARLYDPALMRFLTPDPARQYASPYVFASNSPMNLMDPSGNISVWAQVGIAVAMVGLMVAGVALSCVSFGAAAAPTAAGEAALAGAAVGGEATAVGVEAATAVAAGAGEVAAGVGEVAAAGEVAVGAATAAETGASTLSTAAIVGRNVASLGISALSGSLTGAGTSGLSYDLQHGRDFTAKGFFEAMGVGALTGAVSGGIGGLASMPATVGLTQGMSVTSAVIFRTLTQAAASMVGKDVSTLLKDAVTGEKVTASQMLWSSAMGFGSGALSGAFSGIKAVDPRAGAVSASDRSLVKASCLISKAVDGAKAIATTQAAYATYIAGGFFLVNGYIVWGVYENSKS